MDRKDFIISLGRINNAGLTVRDAMVLYAVMKHPGIHGQDVAKTLGISNRSILHSGFQRMERAGLLEDRRTIEGRAHPNCFHITDKGREFMEAILP